MRRSTIRPRRISIGKLTPSLACILALVSTAACGKKQKKADLSAGATAEVNDVAFLTEEDLQPGPRLAQLSAQAALDAINENLDFIDFNADQANLGCLVDELRKLEVSVQPTSFTVAANVDVTVCVQQELADSLPGMVVKSAKLRAAFAMGCLQMNFADLSGKTLGAAADLAATECRTKGANYSRLLNIEMSVEASGKVAEHDLELELKSVTYDGGRDGASCIGMVTGDIVTFDQCVKVTRIMNVSQKLNGKPMAAEGEESYTRLSTQGLKSQGTENKWFQSGTIEVALNKWAGVVKYGDIPSPPTYTLENTSETISGSLSGPATKLTKTREGLWRMHVGFP